MKLRTVEAYERFRAANQPSIDAAARVGETARRLQEFEKQIAVIEQAREEETATLAVREEDLRLAQEQRDSFLAQFCDEDRQRLIAGRLSPQREAPSGPPSPLRESSRKQDGGSGAHLLGDSLAVRRL